MDLLMLDFFKAIRTFYGWAFPLNLMVTASFLIGIAVEVVPKRGSRIRWIGPLVFACVMVAAELDYQLVHQESHMLFDLCCWFAEAALLGAAIPVLIRLFRTKVR